MIVAILFVVFAVLLYVSTVHTETRQISTWSI